MSCMLCGDEDLDHWLCDERLLLELIASNFDELGLSDAWTSADKCRVIKAWYSVYQHQDPSMIFPAYVLVLGALREEPDSQ